MSRCRILNLQRTSEQTNRFLNLLQRLTIMIIFTLISILWTFFGHTDADTIKPLSEIENTSIGDNVVLSCSYKDSAVQNFQWYRQYPKSKPEFLLYIFPHGAMSENRPHRFSAEVHQDIKQVDLKISSVIETDSVMYYCALKPFGANKIIFGEGTMLRVETKEKIEPSIYKVNNDTDCLATDFTRHDAVDNNPAFTDQNVTVRYEGQSTYSAFAMGTGESCNEEKGCAGESSNQNFESDEKMNFMTVGIFWLRILFLKTVVFNVLMTFKAWMS